MRLSADISVRSDGHPFAPWYALYARHQHEKSVARILSNKGFEVFLPAYLTFRRWKDRTKQLSLPLFPGYIFIHGGLERRLEIVTTPGVHSIVGGEGRPAPIPEREIEAVRRAVQQGAGVEPHPYLRCGDWVRVKTGPLEGIEGILVRRKIRYRLVLSVELLEKAVAVEVDACLVERAGNRSARSAARWSPTNAPATA